MSKTSFVIKDSLKKEDWNEFVYKNPKENVFQTPEMFEVYKRTKRYEPIFLSAVDESDNILASLLAVVIKEFDGFFGSFSARSVIQGGPLFLESEEGVTAASILMQKYDDIAKKKALYTRIRMLHDTPQLSLLLKENGYVYEDHLNFLVDLTKPKEELWNSLSKKRRNDIRRAKKSGVTVKEIEDKNFIPIFYDLIHEAYKNAKLPLAKIDLFESIFGLLAQKNMAKFLLAEYEDNYIGAILILIYKETFMTRGDTHEHENTKVFSYQRIYDWYAGACRDYLRLCPNDLLAWHSIEWGSENGYHTFDFGGAGKPDEEYGVRDFKIYLIRNFDHF